MSDLAIDIEAACRAARRYAQLIHYHDNSPQSQYRSHPFWAWREFMRQFSAIPRGVILSSLVSHSYAMEVRRLVDADKARRANGKGESPAPEVAGKWHFV